MLLDFVCWLEWLKRKTSFSSTERMCHTFWAKAVRDETATPEQKGRWDLLQGQQASWLMGAGGGGCFWIVIFSVKSEARSELSLSRGIEVGGRRSGCEGSSRGGRRTHCRGLGGGRGGGREGVGTRLSSCPVVPLLSLQASSTLVPPVTLGSPARPHPSWQGSAVPSPVLLTWNPPGCPHKVPPLQNFTHQAESVTHHPPRGPHRPSHSCHLLAMALQPGPTILQAATPLPEGGRALAHFPLWHTSTPSPLYPQLY